MTGLFCDMIATGRGRRWSKADLRALLGEDAAKGKWRSASERAAHRRGPPLRHVQSTATHHAATAAAGASCPDGHKRPELAAWHRQLQVYAYEIASAPVSRAVRRMRSDCGDITSSGLCAMQTAAKPSKCSRLHPATVGTVHAGVHVHVRQKGIRDACDQAIRPQAGLL